MPSTHRFALFRNPANAAEKPLVFATLAALARHVHRARKGGGLDLENQRLVLHPGDTPAPGVSIWTTDLDGNRAGSIGWANLDGAGRDVLQAALRDRQPEAARKAA